MKRFMTKKRLVTSGLIATLLVGGGVAFAFIPGGASGSGNGGTTSGGAAAVPVTLSVHICPDATTAGPPSWTAVCPTATPITPGGTALVYFDVKNSSTTSALVTTISAAYQTTVNPMGSFGPVGSTGGVSGCEGVINEGTGTASPAQQFWLTPTGSASMTNVPIPENTGGVTVPPGADIMLPTPGLLHWYNTPTSTGINQLPCEPAPLTLYVTTP